LPMPSTPSPLPNAPTTSQPADMSRNKAKML
jgi:hypothetical protein